MSAPSLKIRRPLTSSCAQACSRRSAASRPPSRHRAFRLGRLRGWLLALADHPFGLVVPAGAGVIALANAAAEHLARQRRFQFAADQALEFTRTELRLVAFFRKMVDQRLIEGEHHALAGGVAGHTIELQADDMADLLLAQRMEDDDLVDAVEELGAEVSAQHVHHLELGFRIPRRRRYGPSADAG